MTPAASRLKLPLTHISILFYFPGFLSHFFARIFACLNWMIFFLKLCHHFSGLKVADQFWGVAAAPLLLARLKWDALNNSPPIFLF